MLLKIFAICLIGLILMSAVIAAIVYRMVANPSGRNVFGDCGKTDNAISFNYEIISTTSPDGVKLNAYFVDNDNTDCLIVVLHGYGSQAKNLLPFVDHFQTIGYSVLIPDLRGHGDSGGICGFGYGDAQDILEWMQFIDKRKSTHYRKVLFGTSMGATTAINVALFASNTEINAVIADSTAPDFLEIIEKVYRWKVKYPWCLVRPFLVRYMRLFGKVSLDRLSLYERIRSLDVPILFIHGKKDGLIDCNSVNELYAHVRCYKEIVFSETADHIGMVNVEPDKYWKKVDGFIIENNYRKEDLQ